MVEGGQAGVTGDVVGEAGVGGDGWVGLEDCIIRQEQTLQEGLQVLLLPHLHILWWMITVSWCRWPGHRWWITGEILFLTQPLVSAPVETMTSLLRKHSFSEMINYLQTSNYNVLIKNVCCNDSCVEHCLIIICGLVTPHWSHISEYQRISSSSTTLHWPSNNFSKPQHFTQLYHDFITTIRNI